jgi:hypothetical protein
MVAFSLVNTMCSPKRSWEPNMESLERLIENRELDVRCPHCHTNNVRALGWLRDRQDMSCAACDELIVLGTAELRNVIRTTSRQLRDLSEQLHTQLRCWS